MDCNSEYHENLASICGGFAAVFVGFALGVASSRVSYIKQLINKKLLPKRVKNIEPAAIPNKSDAAQSQVMHSDISTPNHFKEMHWKNVIKAVLLKEKQRTKEESKKHKLYKMKNIYSNKKPDLFDPNDNGGVNIPRFPIKPSSFKEEKKRGLGWMLEGGDVLQAHKKLLNHTIIRVMCVVDQAQQFRYTLAHQIMKRSVQPHLKLSVFEQKDLDDLDVMYEEMLKVKVAGKFDCLSRLLNYLYYVFEKEAAGEKEEIVINQLLNISYVTKNLFKKMNETTNRYMEFWTSYYDVILKNLSNNQNFSHERLTTDLTSWMHWVEHNLQTYVIDEILGIIESYEKNYKAIIDYSMTIQRMERQKEYHCQVVRELSPRLAKECEITVSDMRGIVDDFHQKAQNSYDSQLKVLQKFLAARLKHENEFQHVCYNKNEKGNFFTIQKTIENLPKPSLDEASPNCLDKQLTILANALGKLQANEIRLRSTFDYEMNKKLTAKLTVCKESFEKCLQKNHIQLIEELTMNEKNKYKKLRNRAISQQTEMLKKRYDVDNEWEKSLKKLIFHDFLKQKTFTELKQLTPQLYEKKELTDLDHIRLQLVQVEENEINEFVQEQNISKDAIDAVMEKNSVLALMCCNNGLVVTSLCMLMNDGYLGFKKTYVTGTNDAINKRHFNSQAYEELKHALSAITQAHVLGFDDVYIFSLQAYWEHSKHLRHKYISQEITNEEKVKLLLTVNMNINDEEDDDELLDSMEVVKRAFLKKICELKDKSDESPNKRESANKRYRQVMMDHKDKIEREKFRIEREQDNKIQFLRDEKKRKDLKSDDNNVSKSKTDVKKEEKTETIRKILSNLQLKNDSITNKSTKDEFVENARKLFLENDPEEIEKMRSLKSENQFTSEIYKIQNHYEKILENVMHDLDKQLICNMCDIFGVTKAQYLQIIRTTLEKNGEKASDIKMFEKDMSKVWSRCLMTNKKARRPRKTNDNSTAENNQTSQPSLTNDRQKMAHSRLHENPRLSRPARGVRAVPKKRGRQSASKTSQNAANS